VFYNFLELEVSNTIKGGKDNIGWKKKKPNFGLM